MRYKHPDRDADSMTIYFTKVTPNFVEFVLDPSDRLDYMVEFMGGEAMDLNAFFAAVAELQSEVDDVVSVRLAVPAGEIPLFKAGDALDLEALGRKGALLSATPEEIRAEYAKHVDNDDPSVENYTSALMRSMDRKNPRRAAVSNPRRAAGRTTRRNPSDLERALAGDKNLEGANLAGADLQKVPLSGANLSEADLRGANLSRVQLVRVNFYGANLEGADLSGAFLNRANLERANLKGANLTAAVLNADLKMANLERANLTGASLLELSLPEANLRGANLRGANLRGANLRGANLRGANLEGTNLKGADLSGADLYGVDLNKANLVGANLTGSNRQKEVAGAVSNPRRAAVRTQEDPVAAIAKAIVGTVGHLTFEMAAGFVRVYDFNKHAQRRVRGFIDVFTKDGAVYAGLNVDDELIVLMRVRAGNPEGRGKNLRALWSALVNVRFRDLKRSINALKLTGLTYVSSRLK